jgi:hypothetical protein
MYSFDTHAHTRSHTRTHTQTETQDAPLRLVISVAAMKVCYSVGTLAKSECTKICRWLLQDFGESVMRLVAGLAKKPYLLWI